MTKSNALQTRLQDLFGQVNKTIDHLLNNLTYIYQSHGINYKVDSFYQPLIRMLTPFQLLSYFHIYDIENLFDKESKNFWSFSDQLKHVNTSSTKAISDFLNKKQSKSNQYMTLVGQPELNIAEKIKKQGNCKYGNMKNYIRMNEEKKLQKQILKAQQMQQSASNEQKQYLPVFGKKMSSSRPHMSQSQQLRICEWVKGMASKGTLISKTDMIHQARLLTNGKTGSTGWCRGFVQRHPYLLNYIKRAKVNRKQKLSYMKSEDGKSVEESIEESENDKSNIGIYNEEASHGQSYQINQLSDDLQSIKNYCSKQSGNNVWLNRNMQEFHQLQQEDYVKQSSNLGQNDERNEKIKRKK